MKFTDIADVCTGTQLLSCWQSATVNHLPLDICSWTSAVGHQQLDISSRTSDAGKPQLLDYQLSDIRCCTISCWIISCWIISCGKSAAGTLAAGLSAAGNQQLWMISCCTSAAGYVLLKQLLKVVITTVVGYRLLAISCWHLYPVSCYRSLFSLVVFCPVSFPGWKQGEW